MTTEQQESTPGPLDGTRPEFVVVHDGWCSEEVKAVHYELETATVLIEIRPDYTGEYREKWHTHPTHEGGDDAQAEKGGT